MLAIRNGTALIDGQLVDADIEVDRESGQISSIGKTHSADHEIDARGLLVLPGIVDIHADAFERQFMPRPGVGFPVDVALMESDRQAIANGITTLFHGITYSWEPGLRGARNARDIASGIERLRPTLSADTKLHLRFETYNFAAEEEVLAWLRDGRVNMLGFNDHMPGGDFSGRTRKLSQMTERSGLTADEFVALVEKIRQRADDVPSFIERLAACADAHEVPTLSHDDMSPAQRGWFRGVGCRIAEFPTTAETAESASIAGDHIVLGAPNVVRGGSHIGWIGAADMIARGFCTILASDYYYPAPLLAAFRLVADGIMPLTKAWAFIAENPARAARLNDRGSLAIGKRGDIIVVDTAQPQRPRVIATICKGRIRYLTEPERIRCNAIVTAV